MSVWNEFYSTDYTDYRIPLKTHLGTITEIAGRLSDIFSDPPSPEQIIARILSSLPIPEFNDIRRTLIDHPQGKDLIFVTHRLLQEEMSLRLEGKLVYHAPNALHVHTSTNNTPSTSASSVPRHCSNCGQGHDLADCFQPGGPIEGKPPAWYAALLARRAAAAVAPVPQANLAYVQTIAM
ncbi:hypothetical protein C8J56DRAFT_1048778 [Mycena floridula]|nr:hypothetical protein C8J56DRAFT_1048778 [Mycena floridula]